MPRDHIQRLDLDVNHFAHRNVRRLKREEPERWPTYHTAWMLVLCDTWDAERRVNLNDAWDLSLPCEPEEALTALQDAGLLDDEGCIPAESFNDWIAPVIQRRRAASERGRIAADRRWANASGNADAHAPAIPVPYRTEPVRTDPNRAEPESRAREMIPSPSSNDELNHLNLEDPVDVWEFFFGRRPTERMRDTYLADWLNTEGRKGVIALLRACHSARSVGDRTAVDEVKWIAGRVAVLREKRMDAAAEQRVADEAQRLERMQAAREAQAAALAAANPLSEAEIAERRRLVNGDPPNVH